MKNLILAVALLLVGYSHSQAPYTEFTMPNTINIKKVDYKPDSLNSIRYLVNNNTGSVYMLWVKSSQVYNPVSTLPLGWSTSRAYYEYADLFSFEPINGWVVLNDANQNTWVRQH